MELIIMDFMKSVMKEIENLNQKLNNQELDMSSFALAIKEKTDEVGRNIIRNTLENIDETLIHSTKRKKFWHVEKRSQEKKIITVLGEVQYKRTYFVSKKDKGYKYLVDEMFGIKPHERMDQTIEAKLIELSSNLSYRKSGKEILVPVSGQTVMNKIREIEEIKREVLAEKKKVTEVLYVEADEDHIHLQNGKSAMPRLVYVHEGIVSQGKRQSLINPYYIGGLKGNAGSLWEEVYEYIKNNYEISAIQRIYIGGDGAPWIKQGLEVLPNSRFVLDKYHMSKYILKATTHTPRYRTKIWKALNEASRRRFEECINELKELSETEGKLKDIEECKNYLINHWDGIVIKALEDKYVLGCSAEGHISHILSDRMSSRPMGWSYKGADQMARLRVYKANKGEVIELLNEQKREEEKVPIAKQILKAASKKLKNTHMDTLNNIEVFRQGQKNATYNAIKNLQYYVSIEA